MVIFKVVTYGRWSLTKVVARSELTVFLLIPPNDAVDFFLAQAIHFFYRKSARY